MENKTEKGIKAYKEWKMGNLRGHYNIGKGIIKRYGLTEADLERLRKDNENRYKRLRRKRQKDIKN